MPVPSAPCPALVSDCPPQYEAHHACLYRVRTLTGKEIELDIEPDYKVRHSIFHFLYPPMIATGALTRVSLLSLGIPHQGTRRRKGRHTTRPTAVNFRRKTNVRNRTVVSFLVLSFLTFPFSLRRWIPYHTDRLFQVYTL